MIGINKLWTEEHQRVLETSQDFVQRLQAPSETASNHLEIFDPKIFDVAFRLYSRIYDSQFGGFGQAPKFPSSHNLSLLLRYFKRTGHNEALKMVEQTLTQMAQGGMYDQLGGGFHRYSTDRQWQIPHFEKMLYDQAILARTYLEAYQITKNEFYANVAWEIFDYVLRDMTDPKGGFYSAEDADSLEPKDEGRKTKDHLKKEGAFYLWTYDEIQNILGDDTKIFNAYFGIKPNGNALSDPHGEFTGKNVLFVEKDIEKIAQEFKLVLAQVKETLKKSREKLFLVRSQRPRPHLDDKILVDWNGLIISSLAFGSRVLNEPQYCEAAQKSAQFILKNLVDKEGRLLHRYRDGQAAVHATIEDYAFFIQGLLDLYEATFELSYLKQAIHLADQMVDLFWDKKGRGFFFVGKNAEPLLYPQKEIYDGAIPSGNSIAALDLIRLYHFTLEDKWDQKSRELFQPFASDILQNPVSYAQSLIALDFIAGPSQEIVIAGEARDKDVKEAVIKIFAHFLPHRVVLLHSQRSSEELSRIAPFTQDQKTLSGKTTLYVCENHMCQLPIQNISELDALLEKSQ